MAKRKFKRFMCGFLAGIITVSMVPVQAIASDTVDAMLDLTPVSELIQIQQGASDVGTLAYELSISPTILETFSSESGGTVSFTLGLPDGIALPSGVSDIRTDGQSLVYDSTDGLQTLVQFDVMSDDWMMENLSGSSSGQEIDFEVALKKVVTDNPPMDPPPMDDTDDPGTGEDGSESSAEPSTGEDDSESSAEPGTGEDGSGSSAEPSTGEDGSGSSAEPSTGEDGSESSAEPGTGEDGSEPSAEPGMDDPGKTPNGGVGEDESSDDTETSFDEDMPDDQEKPEPERIEPATIRVTIPAGVLEADDAFQEGIISLTATVNGVTVQADTTVALKEPVVPTGVLGTPKEYMDGFQTCVFWVDNHNEDHIRLSANELKDAAASGITFTVNGQTYPLNETNIIHLGMEHMPEATVVEDSINTYTLSYPEKTFPTKLINEEDGTEFTVTWNITPPPHEGYDPVVVNAGNLDKYPSLAQDPSSYGWYYILKSPITFKVVLNTGASYSGRNNVKDNFLDPVLQNIVFDNFQLVIDRPGFGTTTRALNESLKDSIEFVPIQGGQQGDEISDEYKTAEIRIKGGWKYNINGAQMIYKINQIVPEGATEPPDILAPKNNISGAPGGVGEDTLVVTYDNTGTTHDSDRKAVYPDGEMHLTLTGEAKYTATKVWQDQGVEGVVRPTATLELWRYRNGEGFASATPVRNSKDQIVSITLDPEENTDSVIPIEFVADESRPYLDSLPKYDSDGFRYVYVVREYLSGTNNDKYQQVFGTIEETSPGSGKYKITDTLPTWLSDTGTTTYDRAENNDFLYNTGTLSNCLNVSTDVEAIKTWKAASFQADFENVIVELTLQYAPINDDGSLGDWSNATYQDGKEIKQVKYGFGEEELAAWDVRTTVPKYGPLGRMLQYRWVETGVYQVPEESAKSEADMKLWYKTNQSDKDKNLLKVEADEGTGEESREFTLHQNGRDIHYQSTTTKDAITGVQTITNGLNDTINYRVNKVWDRIDPAEVTFSLYRIPSGGKLQATDTPYMTFTMDAQGEIGTVTPPADAPDITVANVKSPDSTPIPWNALVGNLPKYDQSGAAYQYVLLEQNGSAAWIPSYQTERANGNYTTTVTNAPGTGQQIMVRKEWVDSSDVTHREPVTIEVWQKGDDKPLAAETLDGSHEWNRMVSITQDGEDPIDLNNVYIKEVRVGGTDVNYDGVNWENPTAVTGTYSSPYHNYEVTYTEMQTILNQNVFIVRNRRVNTVDLTVTKLWKDNNGMLRRALVPVLDALPEEKQITLSLQLKFAGEISDPDNYKIEGTSNNGTVQLGAELDPQPILNGTKTAQVSCIQAIDYGAPENDTGNTPWLNQSQYFFFNLPKYDETGAVVHYTVEEAWLDKSGTPIDDLSAYLETNLTGYPENYPDLAEMLKEYSFSITRQSYKVGESQDTGTAELQPVPEVPATRASVIVPDEQEIDLTNRLSGTKTVYWHKLWDDYYPYSQKKRPDIYLDIYQIVQKENAATGQLEAHIEPYITSYHWDNNMGGSTDFGDQGNDQTHWHVVLDNLPKYDDETGREYYYYAVERTMVNIKQLDYADVTFYIAGDGTGAAASHAPDTQDGPASNVLWPDNGVDNLIKIGMARGEIEPQYLTPNYNNPAKALAVPDDIKNNVYVPSNKFYKYPNFMLLEGGYFSNTLSENVIINGQKLWQSLPNSFPKVDLPALKFNVYRSLDTGTDAVPITGENGDRVATCTVTDWASAYEDGTYQFKIRYYTDENGNLLDGFNGNVVTDENLAAPLPKYDEDGQLYVYTLVEDSIIWSDGSVTDLTEEDTVDGTAPDPDFRAGIFKTEQGRFTYLATNTYDGVKGALSVKKFLELETKEQVYTKDDGTTAVKHEYVYPGVKFILTRSYTRYQTDAVGNITETLVEDATFRQEKIWTSQQVKDAHLAQQGQMPTNGNVEGVITFTDLEKYAPNGSEFQYTITEDTVTGDAIYLGGYDTWAAKGNLEKDQIQTEALSVSELTVTPNSQITDTAPLAPAATFLNKYDRDTPEKYPLQFRKVWRDYDDAFGLRPDSITLVVYRGAETQAGQNNSIKEKFATVTLPTDPTDPKHLFAIEFEDHIAGYDPTAIKWKLEKGTTWNDIEKKNEECWYWTLENFERYAPNGKPWQYIIHEVQTQDLASYDVNLKKEAWGWWNNNDNHHTTPLLINSMYTEIPFSKQWKDQAGNPITQDYLGNNMTVTFQLQVREKDTVNWTDADEYFTTHLDPATLEEIKSVLAAAHQGKTNYNLSDFTATLTGQVNQAAQWNGAFLKLPRCIQKSGAAAPIQLEYRVVETSVKYDATIQTVEIKDDRNYEVKSAGLVTGAVFTADGNVTANTLDTTSLTVQKIWSNDSFNQYQTRPTTTVKGMTWETIFVIQRTTDTGADKVWTDVTKVTLCGTNADSEQTKIISGLPLKDSSGNWYIYRARELEPGESATGRIVENSGDGYYNNAYTVSYDERTAGTLIATNVLKSATGKIFTNYAAEKEWYPQNQPDGESDRTATFELQYLAKDNKTWVTLASVTLDGIPDHLESGGDPDDPAKDMVYGEDQTWHAVWNHVPLIHPDSYISDISGDTTTYRVIETSHTPETYIAQASKNPIADEVTKTFVFQFWNIQPTQLQVVKQWPGVLTEDQKPVEVGLYRTTVERDVGKADDSLVVTDQDGKQLTLTLTVEGQWTGTFGNLPANDTQGNPYYYYALEKLVGDELPSESGFGTVYVHEADKTTITNSRTMSFTGTKTWLDNNNNQGNTRPETLTLKLERQAGGTGSWETVDATPTWEKNGNVWTYTYTGLPTKSPTNLDYNYRVSEETVPEGYQWIGEEYDTLTNLLIGTTTFTVTKRWTGPEQPDTLDLTLYRSIDGITDGAAESMMGVTPTLVKSEDNSQWIYTFSGLDQYDANGVPYTYWVVETVPEGYDAKTGIAGNNGVLENIQQGGLKVSKIVSGNQGETDRAFHFKITLSGTSTAGVPLESVMGRLTRYEGETIKEQNIAIVFTDGVAEFTLKHDQSAVITGLPAGSGYQVEETEANQEGYTTAIRVITGATVTNTIAMGTIEPGEQAEMIFLNDRHDSPSSDTTVTVQGTKTWVDNDDETGARPGRLELILYRSVGGTEEQIPATPVWSKSGNVWTYRYAGLPKRIGGELCIYRVEEIVPEGYTVQYDGYDLVNTLDGLDPPKTPNPPENPTPPENPNPPEDSNPLDNTTPPSHSDSLDQPIIPQTGQLWWPVWVLTAVGTLLVAVGIWKKKRYHGKHET